MDQELPLLWLRTRDLSGIAMRPNLRPVGRAPEPVGEIRLKSFEHAINLPDELGEKTTVRHPPDSPQRTAPGDPRRMPNSRSPTVCFADPYVRSLGNGRPLVPLTLFLAFCSKTGKTVGDDRYAPQQGAAYYPEEDCQALDLMPGDKIKFTLEGRRIVIEPERTSRARLTTEAHRKVLIAPPDAPAMTPGKVKAILAEFS